VNSAMGQIPCSTERISCFLNQTALERSRLVSSLFSASERKRAPKMDSVPRPFLLVIFRGKMQNENSMEKRVVFLSD